MAVAARPIEQRFWPKVAKAANDNDCWTWRGAKTRDGYGVMGRGGRGSGNVKAHRLSYELANGVTLTPEQVVCHRCDNPQCTNPRHLFVGTQMENIDDMNAKGRGSPPPSSRGEASNLATITEETAHAIRNEPRGWGMRKKCAAKHGVSERLVKHIWGGTSWKHLQGESSGT